MNTPSISAVKQWVDAQLLTLSGDILDTVARFIAAVLATPAMPADQLAAIQRSFEPIDDAGTLRMEVNRHDVAALLAEVLRLSAAAQSDDTEEPELLSESTPQAIPVEGSYHEPQDMPEV